MKKIFEKVEEKTEKNRYYYIDRQIIGKNKLFRKKRKHRPKTKNQSKQTTKALTERRVYDIMQLEKLYFLCVLSEGRRVQWFKKRQAHFRTELTKQTELRGSPPLSHSEFRGGSF